MVLDTTSMKLEAVLAGAVSANQPEAQVHFRVWNKFGSQSVPGLSRVALNSNTDVTILAAPTTQGEVREIIHLTIYNKDTAAVTVTVKTDNGTEFIIIKKQLLVGETLVYINGGGWQIV